MVNVTLGDIVERTDLYLVKVPITKTNVPRSFTITGEFYNIVKRYRILRPNLIATRFFINYRNGKCTAQFIGKNKLRAMPRKIAEFLKLPEPELFTGHSFRRTSASILANAGADFAMLEDHGGWKSSAIAKQYVQRSLNYKTKAGNLISSAVNLPVSESANLDSAIIN